MVAANLLSEQLTPVQPATQRHRPVNASHSALFWQWQRCLHPAPNLPGGQAATTKQAALFTGYDHQCIITQRLSNTRTSL